MAPLHYQRIVIIGARGFIGRTLVGKLRDTARVLALDLPEFDLTSIDSRAELLPKLRDFSADAPTAMINAAGLMDASLSRREPDRFYHLNGMAVLDLKRWAADAGIAGLLHLSSETVFGSGAEIFSDDAPRIPIHPYGISKLFAELLLAQDSGAAPPVVAVRLPIVVGNGQAISNPVSIFCDEARRSGSVTIFNGGNHRRKFLHVDDVVGQIAAILSRPMVHGYACYNAGGFCASMREVAEIVAARIGDVAIRDEPSKNQAFTLLSASDRIEMAYGFRPRIDLAAMVEGFLAPATSRESLA